MELYRRVELYITYFLRLSLVFAVLLAAFERRWTVLFASVVIFGLTFLPLLFERRYRIDLPTEFEFVIIVFLYATLFLGEVHGYYTRFFWWDALLHMGSAVAFGFTGFLILYILSSNDRISMSPGWIAVFSFSFAVAIGAVWEIFEFSMDQLFGFDMQKSGLVDTMWDLIVDSVGALLASIAAYFYMTSRRWGLVKLFVKRFFEENPRFQKKK